MRKPRMWRYTSAQGLAAIWYGNECFGINRIAEYDALWKRAVRILNAAEAKPKRARRKK